MEQAEALGNKYYAYQTLLKRWCMKKAVVIKKRLVTYIYGHYFNIGWLTMASLTGYLDFIVRALQGKN